MAFLTAIGLGLGAVGAAKQFFDGGQQKRKASEGLAEFRDQQLVNAAENLQPSLEAERQLSVTAEQQRASLVDVSQGMDAAAAMALVAAGQGQIGDMQMKGFASILDKDFQADTIRVQEEQNMRNIIETRKQQELASLQAQYSAGMQMQSAGIKDLGGLALSSGISLDADLANAGYETTTFGGIKRDKTGKAIFNKKNQ